MARRYYFVAALLVLIGLTGFMVSTPIAGVFDVTPLLNALHIVTGVAAAVAASRGLGTMRAWGQILGYVFAALAVAGFATDAESVANLVPMSNSNAWFHLVMALVFLYHALLAPPTI